MEVTESSEYEGCWCNLPAGLSPVGQLMRTAFPIPLYSNYLFISKFLFIIFSSFVIGGMAVDFETFKCISIFSFMHMDFFTQ